MYNEMKQSERKREEDSGYNLWPVGMGIAAAIWHFAVWSQTNTPTHCQCAYTIPPIDSIACPPTECVYTMRTAIGAAPSSFSPNYSVAASILNAAQNTARSPTKKAMER